MTPPYSVETAKTMPKFERSVSALCWAYNEEELIGDYLDRLNALLSESVEDYEIVLIDDCSTDRTAEIVQSKLTALPRVRYIRNDKNMNVGFCFQRAIRSASKEYLFWQTIDWSYEISMLRIFLEFLRENDVVMGVRRAPVRAADQYIKPFLGILKLVGIRHLTRRSDTPFKALVSVLNYMLIRTTFRVPLSDYQNVAFFPTKLIQQIKWEANSAFVCPETLIKLYWKGTSFAEVPIPFIPRSAGTAKGVTLRTIRRAVSDILSLWFKWIVLRRREFVKNGSVRRLQPGEWTSEVL